MYRKISFFASVVALLFLAGAGCISVGGSTPKGQNGVFRSGDKGETWVAAVAVPTADGVKSLAGSSVYRMFTDPSDVNTMYLSTRGQGLYYSYDKSASWQIAGTLPATFVYGLAVDPKDKCTIYASDGNGHIYKTTDCSRSWRLVYTEERPGQRVVSLGIDAGDSRVIYGAILNGDILLSADSGNSWRVVQRFGFTVQQLTVDPYQPRRLYVAGQKDGLFRSDDAGGSWVDLNEGLSEFSESAKFHRLILHPNKEKKDTLFWLCKYGILRSDDAGKSWTALELITSPGQVNIYSFAVNPNNDKEMYYTGTILGEKNAHVRSTFYKSVDGGSSWVTQKLPSASIPIMLYVHPTENSTVFMGFASVP